MVVGGWGWGCWVPKGGESDAGVVRKPGQGFVVVAGKCMGVESGVGGGSGGRIRGGRRWWGSNRG